MTNQHFSANNTSADLEKAALNRLRSLLSFVPEKCYIFRELSGTSTVLCFDFANCPDLLEEAMDQYFLLLIGANYLGLAHSVVFKLDKKLIGWMTMVPTT